MNRIGTGNAERWLRGFSFGRYQAEVLTRLDNLVYTINTVLVRVQRRFHNVLPPSLLARIPFLLVVLLPLLLFLVPPGRHLRSPAGTMPGIDRLGPRA